MIRVPTTYGAQRRECPGEGQGLESLWEAGTLADARSKRLRLREVWTGQEGRTGQGVRRGVENLVQGCRAAELGFSTTSITYPVPALCSLPGLGAALPVQTHRRLSADVKDSGSRWGVVRKIRSMDFSDDTIKISHKWGN